MKLSTAHQKGLNGNRWPATEICRECGVPWPCDAAIACEEIETLHRVIARLLDGWWPSMFPTQMWKHSTKIIHQTITKTAPMSDGEAAIIRQHQERTNAN